MGVLTCSSHQDTEEAFGELSGSWVLFFHSPVFRQWIKVRFEKGYFVIYSWILLEFKIIWKRFHFDSWMVRGSINSKLTVAFWVVSIRQNFLVRAQYRHHARFLLVPDDCPHSWQLPCWAECWSSKGRLFFQTWIQNLVLLCAHCDLGKWTFLVQLSLFIQKMVNSIDIKCWWRRLNETVFSLANPAQRV